MTMKEIREVAELLCGSLIGENVLYEELFLIVRNGKYWS